MIFSGSAFIENKDFNYSKDIIDNARKKIKEYPILASILDNFNSANQENYKDNYLLMLASRAIYDPLLNGPDKLREEKLKEFEGALAEIMPKLHKGPQNKLISRLKGFDENNFRTIIELEFYIQLTQHKFVKDVTYEDTTSGEHDFMFKLDNTEFNLELTSIGKGRIQEILEEAFKKTAKELLKLIPDKHILKLNVETDKILKEEGKNNSEEIENILIENYKLIEPIIPIIKNQYCHIEKRMSSLDKTLYEVKDLFRFYSEFGERLIALLDSSSGINFLKNIKISEICKVPYDSFALCDGRTKLVEIHSRCLWPSKAEELRKDSLLRQLKNRIKEKIDKKQLKGKTNPLISIYFEDVLFYSYTTDEEPFGELNFKELKELIENVFIKENESEILGVILYERKISKSRFIKNPNAKIDKEILSKICLLAK